MRKEVLLSPSVNLIKWVGDIILSSEEEISKNLIVFPGKRPSYFLRKYLTDKLDSTFKPPVILSMDEFIDFCYERIGFVDTKINALDGVGIIYSLHKKHAVIHAREKIALDEFLPWGFKLFSDFEELYIEFVKPSQLKEVEEIAGEQLPQRLWDKLLSLGELYQSFYENLKERNLSTRALRYRRVAEHIDEIDFSEYTNIIFAGFFAFTKSEEIIIKNLRKRSNVLLVFQDGPGIEKTLESLKLEPEREGASPPKPEIKLFRAADMHGEVFGLREVLEGKEHSIRQVIVIPTPEILFPLVQVVLPLVGDNYNISMGYPLIRTPLFALIEILGKVLETRSEGKYYVPEYLRLILHPYVKNVFFENQTAPTRIIFHTIEEKLTLSKQRFIRLEDIENNKELLEDCSSRLRSYMDGTSIAEGDIRTHLQKIHNEILRRFESIETIGDFADKLIDFIAFLVNHTPTNKYPFTSPFVEKMLDALYELRTSELKNETFHEVRNYFYLLKNYLCRVSVPFEGTPLKGLQVLGFLETRNLKFDTVYFMDANEGIIPNVRKEDTLLPQIIREYLGLPTSRDRERISKYYFFNLINSAKEVFIFYTQGNGKEKSRFVEKLIWDIQKEKKSLNVPLQQEISFRVKFEQQEPLPVGKNKKIMECLNSLKFSASHLDTYLWCPLKFYYSCVLRLSPKEKIREEVERDEIGNIVHQILKEFFEAWKGKPLEIGEEDYERMNRIVDEIFAQRYPQPLEGSLYLVKLRVKKRMRDLLNFHKNEPYRGLIVKELEQEYISPVDLHSGKRVYFKGFVDRIEVRKDTIYIIDYKTGRSRDIANPEKVLEASREKWDEIPGSVQLPFYILLYLKAHPETSLEKINSSLLILVEKTITEKVLFTNTKIDRKALFEKYKEIIFTLIEEILNPEIPFTAGRNPYAKCGRCIYKVLCGRQWIGVKRND